MNTEFYDEMVKWEIELLESKVSKIYKVQKFYKCPRHEKYKDYRNRNRGYGYHYNKETKYIRKLIFRKLRRKANGKVDIDNYYKFTSHDYKTGGWLTW